MSKSKNMYVLQYDIDTCSSSDLVGIRDTLESALPEGDVMLVLPNMMQLSRISVNELEAVYNYAGMLLSKLKSEDAS